MRSSGAKRPVSSRCQRAKGPNGISSATGAISNMNCVPKNGGPTEILPQPKASNSSGASVPISTIAAAVVNSRLLTSSSVSRESGANGLPPATFGARIAYSSSEPPTTTARKIRMKSPRSGSEAKACTEVSTPERTMKVPSSESEKAAMASSSVQPRKEPRFSVTACEWISAVPTSQGMKLAFSTGSQNHQPPQPSS